MRKHLALTGQVPVSGLFFCCPVSVRKADEASAAAGAGAALAKDMGIFPAGGTGYRRAADGQIGCGGFDQRHQKEGRQQKQKEPDKHAHWCHPLFLSSMIHEQKFCSDCRIFRHDVEVCM